MFVEDLNAIPESMRGDFEEREHEGKKGYMHKSTIALANALEKQKQTLKENSEGYKTLKAQLDTFEQEKQKAIQEAREKALEEAKKSGNTEELERLRQQQYEDALKRAREEERAAANKEFELRQAELVAATELQEIITKLNPVDDDAAELIKLKLKTLQKIEDGKIIYLNDDGKASSLDAKKYADELIKAGKFEKLRSGTPATTGGGLPNGSYGGKAPEAASKKEAAKKAIESNDLNAFLSAKFS